MDWITSKIAVGDMKDAEALVGRTVDATDFVLNATVELGFRYPVPSLRIPIWDGEEIPGDYIAVAVDFIRSVVARDNTILVHCIAGQSRSTSLVAAYLAKTQGIGFHAAFAQVAEKRRIAESHPAVARSIRVWLGEIQAWVGEK